MAALEYQGFPIEYHTSTGLICLNDLWRAQCSSASKRPLAWVRLAATQKLLKRLSEQIEVKPRWSQQYQSGKVVERFIVEIPGKLETFEVDNNFRTYTTTELAVVYARFLAPECYEWSLANLAEGEFLADMWAAQQSATQQQEQHKVFSRRAVITAGWSIPVVTTFAFSQRAQTKATSGHNYVAVDNHRTHTDISHTDGGSVTHNDGTHTDISHTDGGRVGGNGGSRNRGGGHGGTHTDISHTDGGTVTHSDGHNDSGNRPSQDDSSTHNDVRHTDVRHTDGGTVTHIDGSRGTSHSDGV
jgi:KilA-N domain